jgi:dUTP pyrophosphatase
MEKSNEDGGLDPKTNLSAEKKKRTRKTRTKKVESKMDEAVINDLQKEMKEKEKKLTPITNSDKVFATNNIQNVDESFENHDEVKVEATKIEKPKGMVTSNPPAKTDLKVSTLATKKTTKSTEENELIELNVKLLNEHATLPTKAHVTDAGWDLYAAEDFTLKTGNYSPVVVSTGIAIDFPEGYWGQIESRSGLSCDGVFTMGGIIDNSYKGEIKIIMQYLGTIPVKGFKKGAKIAQLVLRHNILSNIIEVKSVGESERGERGFGSSGK